MRFTRRRAIGTGLGAAAAVMTATPAATARNAGHGEGFEQTVLWSPMHAIEDHQGGNGTWANPTPVVDLRTGRITVFYAFNAAGLSSRVFRRSSTDDGLTWSDAVEVTDLFAGNERGWTFHLPGPGRGIQLAGGRLLVEVWHRRPIDVPAPGRDYGVSVVHSDDGGRTFTDAVIETNIAPHAGIAAGLAARVDRNGVERVVYTSPARGNGRDTLYARVSHDGAESWSWGRVVDGDRAGYSDVVWLDDSTVVVMYSRLGASGVETLDVVAARLDLTWLTQGNDDVDGGPLGFLHTYQVEGLRAESTDPRAPMILDPAAEGSAATHVPATAPGDAYAVTIVPAFSRPHLLRCRFRAPDAASGGADVVVDVDGRPRGGVVATAGADPFLDVDLGIVAVRGGRPARVTFRVAGPGPGGSHAFGIDSISLVPRSGARLSSSH